MADTLAVKYRPKSWADVTEQSSIVQTLQNQITNRQIKSAYLFCGGAGTGKTTCARIFANEINQGKGNPIELDAASQNGVDDVREIIQQAKMQSLDSEFKVFILDEVHSFSSNAWQALLKLLEEPPAKSIFIMCTTNPEKIPKTILSRVQRYQFQRISQKGIVERLQTILYTEKCLLCGGDPAEVGDPPDYDYSNDALEYIAKIADGGMRDAITMLDKCLAFSTEVTLENVVKAVGATDYDTMIRLTKAILADDQATMFEVIDGIHNAGKDLKLFIRSYLEFMLDVCKYDVTKSFELIKIPQYYKADIEKFLEIGSKLLKCLLRLNNDIKYDANPKFLIEAELYQFNMEG